MREMPQVFIFRVVGLTIDLERDVVRLGVLDLLLTGFDIPFSPRRDDRHIRSEMFDRQLKTHLIVALAGASVADRVRAFFERYVHKALCDAGSRGRGAQQIVFVDSARLHGGDDIFIDIFLGQIQHIELGRAGLDRLFLESVELIVLTDIARNRDDLAVIVVLFEPRNDDRCVQSAAVSQHYFFDICFIHIGTSE